MIATTAFTVLLAIIMTSFLQIGRMYIKGVNLSLVQEDSRNITDSISNDIRFSGNPPTLAHIPTGLGGDNSGYFCVGNHRYRVNLYQQVTDTSDTTKGVVRENVGPSCPQPGSPGDNPTDSVQMLNNGMQLNQLTLKCAATNICTIGINVVFYGSDPTVLSPSATNPNAKCIGSLAGSQFCANTSYTTTVLQSP